jgi:hypothetical protein
MTARALAWRPLCRPRVDLPRCQGRGREFEFLRPPRRGRKYRTIPTLPANLILNEGERAEIDRHATDLDALCRQTPADGDEWEGATLIVITKLMLALPSSQQNEAGAEATGEAFQVAQDDVPTLAVAAAVRR